MNMPKIGILILFFIIFNSNLLANNDYSLKKTSLLLQWKHQFQFAGYYLAKEKGYYKNAGLDVEIKEFQFGLDVATEVKEQKVDFAVGKSTLLINNSNGDDFVLLSAIFQSSPHILLALKENGINTISDLKNKKIMMTGDAKNDATFMSMLFSHQVKADDFIQLEHSFNLKDLVNKKTDLMASYISNEPFRLKEEYGLESIAFDPKDYGFDVYNDILFTSNKTLENNPQKVQKFREASLRGWKYAFDNIEESVNIIYEKYNTQNKSKEALLFEAKELKKLAYYKTEKLGEIKKEKIEKIFHTYKVLGLVNNEVNFDETIYSLKSKKLTSSEKNYLRNKKRISVCMIEDFYPFMRVNKDGSSSGIANDILNILKNDINLEYEIVKASSRKDYINKISNKQCDIIPLGFKNHHRSQNINFTKPFISIPFVLATKHDVNFVDNFSQIRGEKIAVLKDCAFGKHIKQKYSHVDFVPVSSIDEAMRKIVNGEVFGYVGTLEELSYSFDPKYISSIKIGGKFNDKVAFSIGIRDDDIILLNIFEKLVTSLDEDKKQEILNKYVSIKYEEKTDFEALFEIVFLFSFILLILIYFLIKQQRLKKEIEHLNKNLTLRVKNEVNKNRQKDKALHKQARLASMGEMIGNIAHQWRQPLNRINLSAQGIKFILDEENKESLEVNKRIKSIERNIDYMSDTIEDFRNFFHPAKSLENFDVQKIVLKAFKLLDRRVCDFKIKIPQNKNIKLRGYKNEFLQVVLVILNNALDNFELNNITDKKRLIIDIIENDKFVFINITDNSGGIKEDIIDKIFDPYFSTKFKEEGTGLGLYMAKMIIEKSMEGRLDVVSQGNETTFTVCMDKRLNNE